MLKGPLADSVVRMLEDEGYVTCRYSGCFDVAARKQMFLLVKVLHNIDSFMPAQSANIKTIAANLGATPILVGVQTRTERLRPGIVYERFELPTVSAETLSQIVKEGIFPRIYRDRGGLYVEVDRELLKEARVGKGMTQRELAEAVGISKKAIYEHEREQLRMVLSIAKRLEKMLDSRVTRDMELTRNVVAGRGKPADAIEKRVGAELGKIGFRVDYVKQAPFDVFAREKALIVSDIEPSARKLRKRALALAEFTRMAGRPALMITEKARERDVEVPVVERSELGKMSSKEIIRMAKKR